MEKTNMKQELPQGIDINKQEVMKELLQLPVIITNLRTTLLKQEKVMQKIVAKRESANGRIIMEIINHTTDGKKTFPNTEIRKVEFHERCKKDIEITQLKKEEQEEKQEIDISKKDIEYCQNRFGAIKRLTPFFYDTTLMEE